MSADAKKDLSGNATTVNGIVSPKETAKIAQDLVRGLRTFTSEQGFRDLAELVDRIPKLEKEILEKDTKLKRASEDLENGERTHAAELRKNLRLYGDDANRFRKEITNLEQQAKELQITLVQKETAISDLGKKEESLKNAGRKFEDAYKEKASKLKEKELELVKLKKQAEDSQTEIRNLSTSLKGSHYQVTVLKQTLDQCKQRNTQLEERLETACRGLEDLRGMSAILEDTDLKAVATELEELWKSATSLVEDFMNRDIPGDLLKHQWTRLNKTAKYIFDTPLPQSNSAIAKELRIVKVLAILAELIDKYMFQPTYLLPEVSQFKELLYIIAMKEPETERFLRGIMLAVLEDEQKSAEEQLVIDATKELMRDYGVEDIISPESFTEFEQRLKELLTDAQEAWRAIQYSTHIFATEFDYAQMPAHEWQLFRFRTESTTERDDTSSSVSTADPENDFVVLFPRVYLMTSKEDPKPITTGTIVNKKRIHAMVREERENAQSAEQTLLHSRNRSGRTLSMSNDGPRGVQMRGPFLSRAAAPERTNG